MAHITWKAVPIGQIVFVIYRFDIIIFFPIFLNLSVRNLDRIELDMNSRDNRVLNQLFQKKICELQSRNGLSSKNTKAEDLNLLWKQAFEALCEDFRLINETINQMSMETTNSILNANRLSLEFWEDPLGDLYEFFLHNQLSLINSVLLIKPKAVKARIQGIFYTPTEIVQYIVQEITQFLNETPNPAFKIADLACGTGRFLRIWAKQLGRKSLFSPDYPFRYYGYDIDPTAIHIAQSFNKESVFRWEVKNVLTEELPEKYDIIIGNPPFIESRDIPDSEWDYFRSKYTTAFKRFDLAVIFLERIYQCLRPGGWCGLIITNKLLVSDYGEKIRELLLTKTHIFEIVDISQVPIFREVSTYPILIFFQKHFNESKCEPDHLIQIRSSHSDSFNKDSFHQSQILQKNFLLLPKHIIPLDIDQTTLLRLISFFNQPNDRVYKLESAESPYELRDGIHTGNIRAKIIHQSQQTLLSPFKKALTSRCKVERYKLQWQGLWIKYDPNLIQKHNKEYASFREEWIFSAKPKLIIKLFGKSLQVAMDREGFYVNNSLILVVKKNKKCANDPSSWFQNPEQEFYFLLGLLNSHPISYYYNMLFGQTHVRGNFIQYYTKDLAQIPIPYANMKTANLMIEIAQTTQKLEALYHTTGTKNEIQGLESIIDQKVDLLYQLISSA